MELIVEGVVGVIGACVTSADGTWIATVRSSHLFQPTTNTGAASAISAYRGVKRRLRGQGQEDDLLTPTGALVGCACGVSWDSFSGIAL